LLLEVLGVDMGRLYVPVGKAERPVGAVGRREKSVVNDDILGVEIEIDDELGLDIVLIKSKYVSLGVLMRQGETPRNGNLSS
jgi:hypothetical protein